MIGDAFQTLSGFGGLVVACLFGGYMLGGFVKGVVGFAYPMVALAIGFTLLPAETAVAYLAVPTLISNIMQSGRDGLRAGIEAFREFRLMIGVLLIVLLVATQLLPLLNDQSYSAIMGIFITMFAALQLFGWQPRNISRPGLDIGAGALAGFFGGLGGTWGPPVMMTLIAIDLEKRHLVRVAGVMFLSGCVPFFIGHIWSGVLGGEELVISTLLVLPVLAGMWIGQRVQDRVNQSVFRKLVLCVLVIAGLNFLRRAFF